MLRRLRQFQTLQRIRQRQENMCAQEFAAARRQADALREERSAIAREQQRALSEAGNASREQLEATGVNRFYQHARHLARIGDDRDARIQELEAVAEERRKELEEASKKRRMIERLSEREQLRLQAEMRRLEQQQLDEVASIRAARRASQEDKSEL